MTASITTTEAKARLRSEIRVRLAALSDEERCAQDTALFSAFLALPQVEQARTLFLFYGVGAEPDTARLLAPLMARGKRVVLPRLLPGRQMDTRLYDPSIPLVPHRFGLMEPSLRCLPVCAQEIDLVLVPALCYDRQCFRLGLGGGYYDRWLAGYAGSTVGLCRDELLQDRLPTESHDRPVDLVLTPSACFAAK